MTALRTDPHLSAYALSLPILSLCTCVCEQSSDRKERMSEVFEFSSRIFVVDTT